MRQLAGWVFVGLACGSAACVGAIGPSVANGDAAAAPTPDGAQPPPGADAGFSPEISGRELFQTACAPCHGKEGEGTMFGYEIRHPPRAFARYVVRSGREGRGFPGPMAAFPASAISDPQLAEMLDWLWSFPRSTSGQELYADFCANCHGTDAAGGVVGKSIARKGSGDVREKSRQGTGGTAFGNRLRYMPAFSLPELPDSDLAAIARYLESL